MMCLAYDGCYGIDVSPFIERLEPYLAVAVFIIGIGLFLYFLWKDVRVFQFTQHQISIDGFVMGEKVILTEPDDTYSIGTIINYFYMSDTFVLRLEQSTHYPEGTYENHLYYAPRVRIRKIEQ